MSVSYDATTGLTCALLLGCDADQQRFVNEQLLSLRDMARHPLLLPVILISQQQILLYDLSERLWEDLLVVEGASGQTGVVLVEDQNRRTSKEPSIPRRYDGGKDSRKRRRITNKLITDRVLGIVQLASAWESHTKALALAIEAIRDSMADVDWTILNHRLSSNPVAKDMSPPDNDTASSSRPKPAMDGGQPEIVEISKNLKESLTLTLHKANTMLWDLEFINKRAAAQMNAVYNHTAQQIATATKKDSSAMKAVAVLTMAFLPATFIASFFAMPFFDFSADSDASVVSPRFWYYWAVAGPLTVSVLISYAAYVAWARHKLRDDDESAAAQDNQDLPEGANTKRNAASQGAGVFSGFTTLFIFPSFRARLVSRTQKQTPGIAVEMGDLESGMIQTSSKAGNVSKSKA
ncbi:hypothetical protein DL771_007719 [Monosporascus sp. 5C6A]|nr:hypothetical protein DL771_007719 [Monosporascus sp. 5C6A]